MHRLFRKRRTAAENAHLAVSSQMFGSSEEVTDGKKVKEKGIHLFFCW